MKNFKVISGTFVDGIACDIPSNNWTTEQWNRQFDNFKASGFDTVIIIRIGYKDSAMYKSEVMKNTLYEDEDLIEIMLKAAERVGVDLFIGLYDSNKHWRLNDWPSEVAVNRELIHEIKERYSKFSAFKGWYMSHEGSMQFHQTKIWKPLIQEIKNFDQNRRILVSPRYHGKKCSPDYPISPKIHAQHFDYILDQMEGLIDAYAFMDGHVDYCELESFAEATAEVFDKYGAAFWSNLETFDRDMPWRFPPIEWIKLKHKLEVVQPYVEKIITFEAPHFLSPYSMFPSAKNLYERYMDYIRQSDSEQNCRL